jgi:branched-chain amino acid transport system substrate-binding protein
VTESNRREDDRSRFPRRSFLVKAGGTGLTLASSGVLAACGGVKKSGGGGGGSKTITIGYVSPQTGPAAAFGETDPYILGLVRDAVKNGITAGDGKKYDVKIILKDSQSVPQHAASVAQSLINGSNVDMMLTANTPETTNPVCDACEAAGVPCLSTVVPWQSWYFGRGAKPTDKHAFKWTYHFSFGVEDFAKCYISQFHLVPTNKTIGALYPNDADGNAIRENMIPILKKAGFKVVDGGAYDDGLNDFSAQIAKFKSNNCEIFNTFPIPPDFATFWRQAAQQGYKPKLAQIAKTGLFPSQVTSLGKIGDGLATGAFWSPGFPYKSSLTGLDGKQIQQGYEKTGKMWTQVLGSGLALFDAGIAALKAASNPKDKQSVVQAMASLKVDTPVGHLDWTKGPVANVVTDPIIGCQWVPSKGGKFPLDLVITEHADDPSVPIQAKLKTYGTV